MSKPRIRALRRLVSFESEYLTASTTARLEDVDSSPASLLERLPGELRNRIYRHCFIHSGMLRLGLLPTLAYAYPQLAAEITSIYFGENKFQINIFRSGSGILSQEERLDRPVDRYLSQSTALISVPETWLTSRAGRDTVIRNVCFDVVNRAGVSYFRFRLTSGRARNRKGFLPSLNVSSPFARTPQFKTCLAAGRKIVRHIGGRDRFSGYTWADVNEVAACFDGVSKANQHADQ